MARKTIILHREWESFLAPLSDQELGQWLRAVLAAMDAGEQVKLPPSRAVEIAFRAAYERIQRDWQALDRKTSGLVQNRDKPAPPLPALPPARPPAAPAAHPLPPRSAGALPGLYSLCRSHFQELPALALSDLRAALRDLGPELTRAVLERCLANGARQWSYVRAALDGVRAQGLTTAEEYRLSGQRASGRIVDRPSPSGRDFIREAMERSRSGPRS